MKFNILLIIWSCFFCHVANNCCVSSNSDKLARELKNIEKGLPLSYYEGLEDWVERYSDKPLPDFFLLQEPFLDSMLTQHAMPKELKYLPLVLSGMRPDYRHEDRCGVWALPSLVAMRYGLTVDGYHDERYVTEAATKAALNYLYALYQKYNDWWYSILAYANSPNALQHALAYNAAENSLQDIMKHELVPNTKVIGECIACIYVYDMTDRPVKQQNDDFFCVPLHHPIAIDLLAKETGLGVNEIRLLNPVFRSEKMMPLNGYGLRLPKSMERVFESIEQKLYEQTESRQEVVVKPVSANPKPSTPTKPSPKSLKYIVKKGDTLSKIARKHGVTVAKLKQWNGLKSDKIREGQNLIIKK